METVPTFYHVIKGSRYLSSDLHPDLLNTIHTLADYKRIVRDAYGTLRGVTFGVVA